MSWILKVSDPIVILLPIETELGILDTNISVVIPDDAGNIVEIVVVVNLSTLILKELFKDDKSEDNPDIVTISFLFKLWLLGVYKFTLFSDHSITVFSFDSTLVSNFSIDLPSTLETIEIKLHHH
jgi:hypothetical protein